MSNKVVFSKPKISESFHSLLQQLTQIRAIIQSVALIKKNTSIFETISFEGHYVNIPFGNQVISFLLNYTLLKSCSFLEEFNNVLNPKTSPQEKDRIILFKKIVSPATKRINQWSDLKKYRNQMLAHSFRIDDVSFFSDERKEYSYNVPHTDNEIKYLSDLFTIITTNLMYVFPEVSKINLDRKIINQLKYPNPIFNIDSETKTIKEDIEKLKLRFLFKK